MRFAAAAAFLTFLRAAARDGAISYRPPATQSSYGLAPIRDEN